MKKETKGKRDIVAIKPEILKDAIQASRYSSTELSLICGYAGSYISGRLRAGKMSKAVLNKVCRKIEIDMDDVIIAPIEDKTEPQKAELDQKTDTDGQLGRIIRDLTNLDLSVAKLMDQMTRIENLLRRRGVFYDAIVPSEDEVRLYAESIGYGEKADDFYRYYKNNNWFDKNGCAITNWKGRMDYWKANDTTYGGRQEER